MGVKVAKNDNLVFCADWVSIGIWFNFRNCHGWEGVAYRRSEGLVLVFRDVFPGLCVFVKAEVFLGIGFIPDFFVLWGKEVVLVEFWFEG